MTTSLMDESFRKVCDLVATFQANENYYLSPGYQEAEVRKDFIDKFFMALGWDVNHERQPNPYEQEVKVERGVAVGPAKRRADYAFHVAPNFRDPRFLVEAKKPSRGLANADDYFQAIRYGWNKANPLAALTDFDELHILDCRYKPDIATALDRQVRKYHYLGYAAKEKFAEIYWLLSREAVAAGALEKFAETLPKPRGKAAPRVPAGRVQAVDESFLEDLDGYRQALAKAFKRENPDLESETLTEITQRTLDRLVFMRFFEDKLIEPEHVVARFAERGHAWRDFVTAARRLDGVYNGIIFKRHAILDRDDFAVEEDGFTAICRQLSHEHSPYDFNSIPIHILGSIYERFLGNVIVATDKRVRVEQKPEVRKAGGVYYTPDYIVQYIVANTVGTLIEGKTPTQIAGLRFADIACGSGSFLLGVYDLLLRYHAKWYNENPTKAKKGECVSREGALALSLEKKRQILLDNIYGVDIDPQAVEVTQLSLYLKLLEDETIGSIHGYQKGFVQKELYTTVLPSLDKNIVCGNSLIGRDIGNGNLFGAEEERKLNAMDFEDAFPDIMRRGGFDAVVGNPPYIRVRVFKEFHPDQIEYLENRYECAIHVWDVYLLFFERALKLIHERGRVGFIVPIQTLHQPNCESLRAILVPRSRIVSIADLSNLNVFEGPIVKNCVLVCERSKPSGSIALFLPMRPEDLVAAPTRSWPQKKVASNPGLSLKLDLLSPKKELCEKLRSKSLELAELCYVTFGLRSCAKGVGQGGKDRLITAHGGKRRAKPYLEGRDIGRYSLRPTGRYIRYIPKEMYSPRDPRLFETKKIVSQSMLSKMRIVATLDQARYYVEQSLVCVIPHGILTEESQVPSMPLEFILGVMNSRLASFYFATHIIDYSLGGGLIHATPGSQGKLLIPRCSEAEAKPMVSLIEQMLAAKKQLAAAKLDKDRYYYEKKCTHLDREIDALVYELYGLTQEEIHVVESSER